MRFAVYLTNCAALFAASQAAEIGSINEVPVNIDVPISTEVEADADVSTEADVNTEADVDTDAMVDVDAEAEAQLSAYLEAGNRAAADALAYAEGLAIQNQYLAQLGGHAGGSDGYAVELSQVDAGAEETFIEVL